jgi:hypothetical protein
MRVQQVCLSILQCVSSLQLENQIEHRCILWLTDTTLSSEESLTVFRFISVLFITNGQHIRRVS